MRFLPLILTLLVGCHREKVHPTEPLPNETLEQTSAFYVEHQSEVSDEHGFIDVAHCDSSFFSILKGAATPVDIFAAREENGRWHRRPIDRGECFPTESESTISMETFISLMWYAYAHNDLKLVEDIWSYGQPRSWIMGDGPRDLVTILAVVPTLAQLIYKLGGVDHYERHVGILWPAGFRDFRAHFFALHLLLRNRIYGTIEESGKLFVAEQVLRQPINPLFQCLAGNVAETVRLLNSETNWPRQRFPNSKDRCEEWLYQRDFGSDWMPCDEGITHSGADLIFLAYLVKQGLCG